MQVLEGKGRISYFGVEEKADSGKRLLFVGYYCLEWYAGAFLGCKSVYYATAVNLQYLKYLVCSDGFHHGGHWHAYRLMR